MRPDPCPPPGDSGGPMANEERHPATWADVALELASAGAAPDNDVLPVVFDGGVGGVEPCRGEEDGA